MDLALDVADSIQAQDRLEKMLVHEMAVLHRGMMRAATRMDEELYAAAGLDEGRREAANVRAADLPEQYRACQPRTSRACSRYSASEPGETSTSL